MSGGGHECGKKTATEDGGNTEKLKGAGANQGRAAAPQIRCRLAAQALGARRETRRVVRLHARIGCRPEVDPKDSDRAVLMVLSVRRTCLYRRSAKQVYIEERGPWPKSKQNMSCLAKHSLAIPLAYNTFAVSVMGCSAQLVSLDASMLVA